jgi:hypothetical protein
VEPLTPLDRLIGLLTPEQAYQAIIRTAPINPAAGRPIWVIGQRGLLMRRYVTAKMPNAGIINNL